MNLYRLNFNLRGVILRYFSVFGPRQPNYGSYQIVSSIFGNQLRDNKPFTITGNGEQKRDFIYVTDVADANYRAMFWLLKGNSFNTFNVGSGTNFSINEIANTMAPNHPIEYIAPRIEPMETLCDNTKIRNTLGWEPTISIKEYLCKPQS